MDTFTDDGWQVPPDGYCLHCQMPYRYECSDARDYQRYDCGDCERAAEKPEMISGVTHNIDGEEW